MTIHDMINNRAKTHGDFTDMANTAQEIKNILHKTPSWRKLTYAQREAVEMIVHKLARLTAGNPNAHDHWQDIIGYAQMALDRIPVAPAGDPEAKPDPRVVQPQSAGYDLDAEKTPSPGGYSRTRAGREACRGPRLDQGEAGVPGGRTGGTMPSGSGDPDAGSGYVEVDLGCGVFHLRKTWRGSLRVYLIDPTPEEK
jgi:hypothetical protein